MKNFKIKILFFAAYLILTANLSAQLVSVSLPNVTAKKSETIKIPLSIGKISNSIDEIRFRVDFNKDILKVLGVETTNTLTGEAGWNYDQEKRKDFIEIITYGRSSSFSAGTLMYLNFEVKDDVKDGDVSELRFDYFDFPGEFFLIPRLNNGSVSIQNTAKLSVNKTGDGSGKLRVDGKDKNLPYEDKFDLGSTISISALPDEGSEFILWDGSFTSQNETIEISIDGDKNLTAEFRLLTYSVNCAADPTNGGTTQGCGDFKFGETANVSASPSAGWEFVNWIENGLTVSNQKNYSFTVTRDRNLKANFRPQTFTINCSADPSQGGVTDGCGSYLYGETANLKATPNTGYDFVNWTEGGNVISSEKNISFPVNGNRNLTANFKLKNFTIDCSADPSSAGSTEGCREYKFGETANLKASPVAGWEFVNWTENGNEISDKKDYSFTVTKNRSLTANFRLRTFSVNCSANPSAGGVTDGCRSYLYGETASLKATPNNGYDFVNWTEDGKVISTERNVTFPVNGNRNLTANFKLKKFTVDCSANPSSAGSTEGCGRFDYGKEITASAKPDQGWNFLNWTENGNVVSSDANYKFTVTRYRNLIANFSERSFTIDCSANPSQGGSTSGCGVFKFNQEVTVTAAPKTGWSFVNWMEGSSVVSTERSYKFTVRGSRNLTANFKINSYSIICAANPEEGGVTEGCGAYEYGETAILKALPNQGWSFVNWTENGNVVSTNNEYSFNVTGPRNLTANFSINSYSINCESEPSQGGTTSGCGTFKYGTEITLTASPKANYDFVNWTENGVEVSTKENYSFTVTGNRNLKANFSLETHTVTCTSVPSEGGMTNGCGIFEYGKSVTLNAVPNEGWSFVNWTIDDTPVSTEREYTFTVNAPVNIQANFSKITFSVDCSALPPEGGITSGCGFFYFNQQANLTAMPNAGYKFEKWTEDGITISDDKTISIQINKNRIFTAHFSREEYKISCSPQPNEAGITSGCGFFYYDQMANLIATPNEGYTFINWTIGDSVISSNASFSFKVKDDEEIKANFEFVTSVKDLNFQNSIPDDFYLANNYPNPFNPTTIIEFGLPFESDVRLNIFDINGQLIQEVIAGENLRAGKYSKTIHLNSNAGIASGIYFYQILAQSSQGKSFNSVKKMLYLK